jgi:formylglycine-generating enzyme required for sulfatase activity
MPFEPVSFNICCEQINMKFVHIPPGTFMMGSLKTLHRVTLTKGFYMQTTQVTQKQWKALTGNNPSWFRHHEECPLEDVSWHDVQDFINKLNDKEGSDRYRLPTEAEWEYACRAGSDTTYCFGNDESELKEYAWYEKNSDRKTHPVGQLKPNPWGLYDMHGNVWEWCRDLYANYPVSAITDPMGNSTGSTRILRGGSWYNAAGFCRSSSRDPRSPYKKNPAIGFRLVRDL